MRQQATDSLSKDLYKLKNNALFGKTMESVRDRKKFKLTADPKQFYALCSRDEYLSSIMFTPDVCGVHLTSSEVSLNKPVYIRQAVLDLSKLVMYQLRYLQLPAIERKLGGTFNLVAGDTDSFMLECVGMSLEEILGEMARTQLLDSSNYPTTHPLHSIECKAKLGCVKDESRGCRY